MLLEKFIKKVEFVFLKQLLFQDLEIKNRLFFRFRNKTPAYFNFRNKIV